MQSKMVLFGIISQRIFNIPPWRDICRIKNTLKDTFRMLYSCFLEFFSQSHVLKHVLVKTVNALQVVKIIPFDEEGCSSLRYTYYRCLPGLFLREKILQTQDIVDTSYCHPRIFYGLLMERNNYPFVAFLKRIILFLKSLHYFKLATKNKPNAFCRIPLFVNNLASRKG